MISTGPNGGGSKTASSFFMANIWSGSASNIAAAAAAGMSSVSSSSSRAFQHSRLKSGSEESLNSVLLQDEQKNSLERGGKVLKVKRSEKQIRKRCLSQNDTVSEQEYVVSPEHLKNNTCCLREHEGGDIVEDGEDEDGDGEDGSITETSKSKCVAPVKVSKRLGDLKKSERSKQKELLASILDDTDDLDQLEYFDDNEIYPSSSPASLFSSTSSSTSSSSPSSPSAIELGGVQQANKSSAGKQTSPKNSENVAFELLRVLSIKSTNMWWRWGGNKGSKDSSMEETPIPTGSDLLELELKSMNRANSASDQPPASPTKSDSTIMSKLKNFAKLSEEKEKLEKFTFYTDEPDQKPNLMLFKGCNEIYKVKSNEETLRSIAARYKTTPAEIKVVHFIKKLKTKLIFSSPEFKSPFARSHFHRTVTAHSADG